jgi:hypothetical protein
MYLCQMIKVHTKTLYSLLATFWSNFKILKVDLKVWFLKLLLIHSNCTYKLQHCLQRLQIYRSKKKIKLIALNFFVIKVSGAWILWVVSSKYRFLTSSMKSGFNGVICLNKNLIAFSALVNWKHFANCEVKCLKRSQRFFFGTFLGFFKKEKLFNCLKLFCCKT